MLDRPLKISLALIIGSIIYGSTDANAKVIYRDAPWLVERHSPSDKRPFCTISALTLKAGITIETDAKNATVHAFDYSKDYTPRDAVLIITPSDGEAILWDSFRYKQLATVRTELNDDRVAQLTAKMSAGGNMTIHTWRETKTSFYVSQNRRAVLSFLDCISTLEN